MKMMLRIAAMLALVCALVRPAKAFQMIVIDPNYTDINSTPYGPFTFSPCQAGQGVDPSVYQSCFTALNDTGSSLTNVSIFVPFTAAAPLNSTIDCNTSYAGSFFQNCTSSPDGNGYLLNFSVGSIPNGFAQGIFTIALDGPTADFGPSTLAANTPEPDSLMLLSTGILSAGAYVRRRRRM